MSLPQWHAWPPLLVLTLAGDVICVAFATFVDTTARHRIPHLFWWILWLAQIPLGIQVLLGLVLLGGGAWPRTPFHLMYGGLVILTVAALFGLRPGGPLRRTLIRDEREYRESRWLMLLCSFLAALVARAYMTGIFGR